MHESILFDEIRRRPTAPIALPDPIAVSDLPTPALVLERSIFDENLNRMAAHVTAYDKGFRPHAKTHKCPEISRQQMARGAVGVCVAKVSEAVAQTGAGISQVLITSPITTSNKVVVLDRLCGEGHDLMIVVDSLRGLEVLQEGIAANHRLGILIDLDVNMGRTGARDDNVIHQLIESITNDDRFEFQGFQFYAGHVMHIEGFEARKSASLELWDQVCARLEGFAQYSPAVITGCGTGTFNIDVEVEPITDLQVGSFIFMDEEYRRIGGPTSERFADFDVSLTIAATTISQPMEGGITVDSGFKSMASDTVPAAVDELANTKFRFAGDEHGVLLSRESMQSIHLGDVVRLVTPHCDPTVNLHDYYWVLEDDGLVHNLWPITGRGCTW